MDHGDDVPAARRLTGVLLFLYAVLLLVGWAPWQPEVLAVGFMLVGFGLLF